MREHVAEFLLLNAQFPRSGALCRPGQASLRDIARAVGKSQRVWTSGRALRAMLDFNQIDEIMAALRTYVREVRTSASACTSRCIRPTTSATRSSRPSSDDSCPSR
jgi:uncharacterized alpha-E superfamily protein